METLVLKSFKTLLFIIIFFCVASRISTPLPMPSEHSRMLAIIGDRLGAHDLDAVYVSLLLIADLIVTTLMYQIVVRSVRWMARIFHRRDDDLA